MIIIATRPNADGSYDKVGMNNRTLIKGLKTIRGVKNRLLNTNWARKGQKIQFERHDDGLAAEPTKTWTVIMDW